MAISPQIRYAVERARDRAVEARERHQKIAEKQGGLTLQLVCWADEVESLEEAVEILKGLE